MNDQVDSGRSDGEQAGRPNQQASQGSDVQPNSQQVGTEQFVDQIFSDPRFADAIDRKFQSMKDRRIGKLETEMGSINENLSRMAQYLGVEPGKLAEAQRQMDLDDMIRQYQSQRTQPNAHPVSSQQSGGTGLDMDTTTRSILTAFGVNPQDPAVGAFLSSLSGTTDQMLAKVSTWAANYKTQAPPPSAAQVTPPQGGGIPKGEYDQYSDDQLGEMALNLMKTDPYNKDRQKYIAELERRSA